MNPETGEKTEQPTPKKLDEAYKQGQFAHSAEVQTVFVLMAGILALLFTGRDLWRQLVTSFIVMLGHLHDVSLERGMLQAHAITGAKFLALCVGPIVLAAGLGGLLAGAIQNRFHTASEALTPNWERLDPVQGLKRVFSMRSATPTVLGIIKLGVIIALSYSLVKEVLSDPIFSSSISTARIAQFLAESSFQIILRIGLVLMGIAAVDYTYQFWKNNQDLMMTKDEVKDEMKHTEGNPLIKAQRRRRRAAITIRKMLMEVPKADVVVTNPTHLAIALRYDRKTMRAPKIVAKGARLNARRIREIAQKHQVPIIENKPLAQMMRSEEHTSE